jgi:hypothetical protein
MPWFDFSCPRELPVTNSLIDSQTVFVVLVLIAVGILNAVLAEIVADLWAASKRGVNRIRQRQHD